MLYTLLLSVTALLWGCGGDGKDEPQPAVNITVSQDNIALTAMGGTTVINVTTTGKEWGAYADQEFITLDAKDMTSTSGTLTVIVPANPLTDVRKGTIGPQDHHRHPGGCRGIGLLRPRGLQPRLARRVRQGLGVECRRLDP